MRKQILAFGLMAATASMAAVISDFEKDTQAALGTGTYWYYYGVSEGTGVASVTNEDDSEYGGKIIKLDDAGNGVMGLEGIKLDEIQPPGGQWHR